MKTCGLLVLLWLCVLPASALDMTQPASVQVRVQDAAGHPLPHADVQIGTVPVSLSATGAGTFTDTDPEPVSDISWTVPVHVTLSGFLPLDSIVTLFPGAQVDVPVTLYEQHKTVLHLRGPYGQPLAGVGVTLIYATSTAPLGFDGHHVTDAHGDCVLIHPPITSKITVSLNIGQSNVGPQNDYADAPEITIRLTPAQMPPVLPVHPLHLTLLDSDGTPAAGWQVASQTKFTGSRVSSAALFPGPRSRTITLPSA